MFVSLIMDNSNSKDIVKITPTDSYRSDSYLLVQANRYKQAEKKRQRQNNKRIFAA